MDRKLWTEARAIAARRDPRAADDLAQDLACAVLEDGARGVERPAAWLERVGRNAAIDRQRVEQRRAELAPHIEPPAAPADPETALLARERRGLVRRALALLPRPQRRAALLRFHAELPFRDVAARLGHARGHGAHARPPRAHQPAGAAGRLRAIFVRAGRAGRGAGADPARGRGPRAAPTAGVATAEAPAPPPSRTRHFARTRLIAAEAPPAPGAASARSRVRCPRRRRRSTRSRHRARSCSETTWWRGRQRSEGGPIVIIPPTTHSSLIELRRHFVAEVAKTMEDL